MNAAEIGALLADAGHPRYRVAQVMEWVFDKGAGTFDEMTNLPKTLRTWLAERSVVRTGAITAQSDGRDATEKLLLTWPDQTSVECVWIPEETRNTACISSQVGCPVGCRFCASGIDGVVRNLTASEIVEQALAIRDRVRSASQAAGDEKPARLTNIVFMGMGEPLANYDEVLKAVRRINALDGLAIGARKITLSTVGLPKQIRRLAKEDIPLNLALSLHAPNDELRARLIPWGRIPIRELIDACRAYFDATGREITLEYILLAGINCEAEHAEMLARICRQLRCNVNLLRYNPVPGLPFRRPEAQASYDFQKRLKSLGVNAHLRRSRGRDIDAACGQLRRRAAAPSA